MFHPDSAITVERLQALAIGHSATYAGVLAPHIAAYADDFNVTSLVRCAHFLAQLCHESAHFGRMSENLNYRSQRITEVFPRLADRAVELAHRPEALANAAYAGRFGNGDEASRDGWRYHGRGPIQLTFRDNYREMGVALGIDLIGGPDQAAEPEIGVRIALQYWKSRGCNDAADLDDVEKVTRLINGGTNGLGERRLLTELAKRILTPGADLVA